MFFWSRFPFVRVVLFLILGILLGVYYPEIEIQVQIGFAVSIITLIVLVLKRKNWVLRYNYFYGISLSLIFLFFGYTILKISNETNSQNHLIHFDGGTYYTGTVNSDPQIKGEYIRLKLDVEAIKDSVLHETSGKVLVYLKLPIDNTPGYGDKLLIKGFPLRVSPPLNPQEFDYRQYLAYNNIYHQHFIARDYWHILNRASGFSLHRLSINARKYLEDKLTLFIPRAEELAVAKALILGKKEDLDRTTKEIYAKAGAMHVLAVSGLHVGIIYLVLLGLLRQKQGRVTRPLLVAIIVIPTLWAYAFITGLSPSVLRAVTMFSFLALAQVFNRRSASLNTLAISAFILLLVNPYMIMAVGFQLSYIAVAGIIFLYPVFEKWYNPENPILRFIWQITALSLAAQLVTSPLSAFYFHRFPTYFIFSNLLVIPAAITIVWGGLVLLALGSISSALGLILGKVLGIIILVVNQSLHWIATLPNADIHSLTTTRLEIWLLYGLIIMVFLYFTTRKWSYYWVTAILVIVFSFNIIFTENQSNKLKQLVFYSVNYSWAIDFIEDSNYHLVADSLLQVDINKINYNITPYRRQNGLSCGSIKIKKLAIPELGEVIVWHGKRILLASPCLEEKDIPRYFDYVLFKVGRTAQNCYQEQILLRRFVNNQGPSYNKYYLRSQGALIVDI